MKHPFNHKYWKDEKITYYDSWACKSTSVCRKKFTEKVHYIGYVVQYIFNIHYSYRLLIIK